jgi:hypothetical protein
MPDDIALVAWGEEHLSLVRPATETPVEEDDLFAGLRG